MQELGGLSDQGRQHHVSEGNLGLGLLEVPLQPLRLSLHDFTAQESGELLLADLSEELLVEYLAKYELSTWQSSRLHDGHPEQVVLGYLEHLLQSEILRWLKFSAQPTPCHWCSLFAVRPELLEAVVDAVEEHLVVNVLALGQKVLVDSILAELLIIDVIEVELPVWLLGACEGLLLPTLLPALLQLEV